MEKRVYLKSNVAIEPLIDRWYAWTHLIYPPTLGLNILNRHLRIMRSYIRDFALHSEAIKQPAMKGGPFIDYKGERVDEIEELMNESMSSQNNLLSFAKDILEANSMLLEKANGNSLNELYSFLPESLKGLVELVYDLNNFPKLRFFEGLVYNSEYYKPSIQSVQLFLIDSDDSRSFVLSTPRLKNTSRLELDIPFDSEIIDKLSQMRSEPDSYENIKKICGIDEENEELFKTFFTDSKPKETSPYVDEGIRVRYFGHACVLIETNDVSILVDPVISYFRNEEEFIRYTFEDLPDTIDYVLITHNHQDHVLIETLIQLRHKIKNIIVPMSNHGDLQDPRLKLILQKIGFNNVIEISDFDEIKLNNCTIIGVPFMGEHADLDIRSKISYNVRLNNKFNILFIADSCNISEEVYNKTQKIIGDIDVLFLGMECDGAPLSWIYGALMPKQIEREKNLARRLAGCNYDQALHLVKCFKPKDVFVYAMGLEPWLEFITSIKYTDKSRPIVDSNRLLEYCTENGITSERLYGEKILIYNTDKNDFKNRS